MAYGLLYYNSYYTDNAEYTTVEIYKKDYSSTTYERDLGANPLILKQYSEGDQKWKQIKGVEAIVELISESDYEFSDMFTAENYTYLLIVHKGVSTEILTNRSFLAGSVDWALTYMEWGNQSLVGTGVDPTGEITQSIDLENNTEYTILIDVADCEAAVTTFKTYFGATLIDTTIVSATGERITIVYTWTGGAGTETFKIAISDSDGATRITNISLLKSGESHSYVPIFAGHSMQENYIEPEVSAPYTVQLSFSNGLGDLKNNAFEESKDTPFIGQKQILDVVNFCLQKCHLYLPVYVGIDIYDFINDSDGDDPFFTKWINMFPLRGMDCQEVLNEIFKPFLLNIKQVDCTWQIVKITKLPYNIDCKLYNTYNDLLDSLETLNYVQATDASNFLAKHDHQNSINPGLKKYEITQEYGIQENILNTNFQNDEVWTDNTTLKYWNKSTSLVSYERNGDGVKINGMRITGVPFYYIGSDLTIDHIDSGNATSYTIKLKYFVNESNPFGTTWWNFTVTNETSDPMSNKPTQQLVTAYGEWVEYEVSIAITAAASVLPKRFRAYLGGLTNSTHTDGSFNITYKDFTLQFNYTGDEKDTETAVLNDNNNKTGDAVNLTIGDMPNIPYAKTIFQNGLYTGAGAATSYDWALNGESISSGTLLSIIKNAINYSESTPMQIFRGSLYGNWRLEHVLEFTSNSNKRYILAGGTWNDKQSTLTGEYLEIYWVSGGLPSNRLKINSSSYGMINGTEYILIS